MNIPTTNERIWAVICQLLGLISGGFFITLIIWLVKRKESAFIDVYGKEALNFQLSVLIYSVVAYFITFMIFGLSGQLVRLLSASTVFILFALCMTIFVLYTVISAAVKAYRGEMYYYPFIIRFIK
jgi:uncharacterized Tic20 family protein